MSGSFKVDVSPDMGMYRLLQSQSYSVHSALSEFVDNSVQSYIDRKKAISSIDKTCNQLKVTISIRSNQKEIIISDNAAGINSSNFQRAIKMGTDTIHKKSSLSKFGVGMKTAAVWLSNTWIIETSALNSKEKLICKFDLNKLLEKNETEISVSSTEEKEKIHYTKIIIKNCQRMESEKYYKEILIPHLAETFVKFKDLSIEVKYNDDILPQKWKSKDTAYFEPPEPLNFPLVDKNGKKKNDTYKKWKQRVNLTYKEREVKGFFMIMEKGSYSQPGIRLFRNRRVIQGTLINPNRPQILLGTENKYASQRLYGELHLNEFDIDFMKTKFSGDLNPLYLKLKNELQKKKFIDQVNYYRSRKDQNKESEKIDEYEETPVVTKKPTGELKRKKRATNNITKIKESAKIRSMLENMQKKKLFHLYNSLCTISLIEHPYLAYIGSWAFLECISVVMGKNDNHSFDSFYGSKLHSLAEYKGKKQDKKRIHDAIKEIHAKGNFSKHDFEYEFEDAKQLHHAFNVLEDFIIKCINSI